MPDRSGLIDVREMIATTSLDDLNRTAESYFSKLTDWDFHLAKPFSNVGDAPAILMNFAVVMQGLRLVPGLRILDFGAGSGWTSRFLTQLGCEVIVLDVSATALRMARELFNRQPVIGEQPPPRFLEFDGRRIDLPDESVDRILCFDAFHHAPSPKEMLAEFARILVPGGIAGFAEPGPNHSLTPQSQFEMRTYGVIENDVDIHAIAGWANELGFSDLKLAAFHGPPFHLDLSDYEDLLEGGETSRRLSDDTRNFLKDVRTFFLTRHGSEPLDSRRADALRAEISVAIRNRQATTGSPIEVEATLTNRGSGSWLPSREVIGGVCLGCHLYDSNGVLINFDHHWEPLKGGGERIEPDEEVNLEFSIAPLDPGSYIFEFDCVARGVGWFSQKGSPVVKIPVTVTG